MTTQSTVIPELNLDDLDVLHRRANETLMIKFINDHLLEGGAGLDIRRSIVLYDDAKVFEWALAELPSEDLQRTLLAQTNVRYWSKGCVK
jgi:hypothetical protein